MIQDVRVIPINQEPIEFEDVEFLSFINAGTYGPPAIIAPGKDHVPTRGDRTITVLYVNTAAVISVEATKTP